MKHYLIYQIQNKLNGMIYIGQHQTDDINDGYMGSGLRIQRAIKKYGIENFEKIILFECSTEEEMNQKEIEIVNEEFISREDVYNIALGGSGNAFKSLSFEIKSNASKLRWKNMSSAQKQSLRDKCSKKAKQWNEQVDKIKWKNKISEGLKKAYLDMPQKKGMLGKHHSISSKQKMSELKKNPVHNKMISARWIYNPQTLEVRILPNNEKLPDNWKYGRKPQRSQIKKLNHPNCNFCWISKEQQHKYVKKSEIEFWLNSGWHKGRK